MLRNFESPKARPHCMKCDVTLPSWDEVDVTMKDRLSGVFACVHAHIKPGDIGILLPDARSFRFEHSVNGIALGWYKSK